MENTKEKKDNLLQGINIVKNDRNFIFNFDPIGFIIHWLQFLKDHIHDAGNITDWYGNTIFEFFERLCTHFLGIPDLIGIILPTLFRVFLYNIPELQIVQGITNDINYFKICIPIYNETLGQKQQHCINIFKMADERGEIIGTGIEIDKGVSHDIVNKVVHSMGFNVKKLMLYNQTTYFYPDQFMVDLVSNNYQTQFENPYYYFYDYARDQMRNMVNISDSHILMSPFKNKPQKLMIF